MSGFKLAYELFKVAAKHTPPGEIAKAVIPENARRKAGTAVVNVTKAVAHHMKKRSDAKNKVILK